MHKIQEMDMLLSSWTGGSYTDCLRQHKVLWVCMSLSWSVRPANNLEDQKKLLFNVTDIHFMKLHFMFCGVFLCVK